MIITKKISYKLSNEALQKLEGLSLENHITPIPILPNLSIKIIGVLDF